MIMGRKRRAFSAIFKAIVALDAIKGLKTSGELAGAHGVQYFLALCPLFVKQTDRRRNTLCLPEWPK